MNPKLSDRAVADLPLAEGRAELLEEIMNSPVPLAGRTGVAAPPGNRRARWVAPVAAAVAVVVLGSVAAWWPGGGERERLVAPAAPPASAVDRGHRAVLDAIGWEVTYTHEDPSYGGEVSYDNGDQQLDIRWSPAASYGDYVEDRQNIAAPPDAGEPIEVLGLDGRLWHYSSTDHTVIREVQDRHWMEFRGSGMDDAEFRELLVQLRLVDQAGFEAALPSSFVVSGERREAIEEMLAGIDTVADPLTPVGTTLQVASVQADPYHLGADVAGAVMCAWLEELDAAAEAGNQARVERSLRVLGSAADWPVLLEMQERGDYPEVAWEIAELAIAGRTPPREWRQGLGC